MAALASGMEAARTIWLLYRPRRRQGCASVALIAPAHDYDDYRDLLAGIEEAAQLGDVRSESEVCIDVMPGPSGSVSPVRLLR